MPTEVVMRRRDATDRAGIISSERVFFFLLAWFCFSHSSCPGLYGVEDVTSYHIVHTYLPFDTSL